ncbi:hypothetical protein JCM3766R1_006642 [Sporobolomyces carnicolor]
MPGKQSAAKRGVPPPPHSTQPHGSLHQSSFHNLTLEHSLEDLSARFIVNLPAEELESMDRVCFQIEQAHWYYEDFIRPAALNPGLLPSYGLKAFSLLMFRSCPLLHDLLPNHNKIWNSFMAYKERVPVCGAIIISEYWDKVLLVKGWTKGSSWSFPRGKINKEEPEAMCAVREVLEETGFDMANYFHPSQFQPGHVEDEGSERIPYYVELVIKEQKIRLYFIPGVREDTVFETRTRKEISKIEWFKLNDLPTWGKDKKGRTTRTKAQLEGRQAKFYMVTPFISHLKLWIDHHKPKNLPPRPTNVSSPLANQRAQLPPSPPFDGQDDGDDYLDDPTYHLPSEIELGDSTSAEADSTEDELDDFNPPGQAAAFETTQQGTEALTALFFGSPPSRSDPLPLAPPTRSQSFEVASTPPHIAYERQSSFLQPKPQNAVNQQTKLLDLLSGAVPSPPPPVAPKASHPDQQFYQHRGQQPQTNESRSLLHLLNDVNLCDSPTTPQDSTPQHASPLQQPHAILFSGSQAPPEARDFGQPLPAHLQPDRNDNERKEKHNALLRALLSVATRPTPPQALEEQPELPNTPTFFAHEPLNGQYADPNGAPPRRDEELGRNGIPYGPDEDDEVWPPKVLRRNQLYPLDGPQLPDIAPTSASDHRFDLPPPSNAPLFPGPNAPFQPLTMHQNLPEQPTPNLTARAGGSLLSILNGRGGERAQPSVVQGAGTSSDSEPRAKDPLELLREHRAKQMGQDIGAPPSRVEPPQTSLAPPTAPSYPVHPHGPLPVPPPQGPAANPPLLHTSAPPPFPGIHHHQYLPPPHQPANYGPSLHQPSYAPHPFALLPPQHSVPPQLQQPASDPSQFHPPSSSTFQARAPETNTSYASQQRPLVPATSRPQTQFPPVASSAVSTTVPPRQETQPVPSFADFPPLGASSNPSAPNAGKGKNNAGALLGLFNSRR